MMSVGQRVTGRGIWLLGLLVLAAGCAGAPRAALNSDVEPVAAPLCPRPLPATWIFCDDFERGDVASRYLELSRDAGDFRRVKGVAASGTHSMQGLWQRDEVGAGGLKVTFGRNPIGSFYRVGEDFDEIFWRIRVRHAEGWQGSPGKLSRAVAFARRDWSEALIAHLWSAGPYLLADPVSCVQGATVHCSGYNDFDAFQWLGRMPGSLPLFTPRGAGRWHCVEAHVRLDTPGAADGVFEFWIDGERQAVRRDLNWRGRWTRYGLNAVFVENWWNAGAPREQRRWFDDLAIATARLGCD